MLANADDTFTTAVQRNDLEKLIGWFDRRLGGLTSCEPVQVDNWRTYAGTSGVVVVATYRADCQFDRGKGRVTLQLIRRDRWRIQGIHVNSDSLMDSK